MLINSKISPLPANQPWPRDYTVTILQTALRVQEFRFVRQTALNWLASYPGDLPVSLLHGKALLGEGHISQAHRIAKKICDRDPEFLAAQELLEQTLLRLGKEIDPINLGNIQALGGTTDTQKKLPKGSVKTPKWIQPLQDARQALEAKNFVLAESKVQKALALEGDTPLTALTHLRILASQEETPRSAIQNLAAHFHQRFPECIPFILLLADTLMEGGDSGKGVALLHQATVFDVTGQVPKRLWGEHHPYLNLWPSRLTAVIENPIPARVSAALGWNLLDSPEIEPPNDLFPIETPKNDEISAAQQKSVPEEKAKAQDISAKNTLVDNILPETLRSVQAELENVSEYLQQPFLAQSDGRFPTYVILTTRKGLREKYGRAGSAMLEASMQELALTIRQHPDWGSLVFIADDPVSTSSYDVKPALAHDPWSIKLALADLDAALAKKGVMIGAVLIVGGPQIVPFHKLPNPTDDPDVEVPSDNPYATRDENYFIPEWPVGRLPDGIGNNPSHLLAAIQNITSDHALRKNKSLSWGRLFLNWLRSLWQFRRNGNMDSFGFSAEVWRKASIAVYRQIGSPGNLITSPPINIETKNNIPLTGQLGYFNLHGLADTDEWYGQRDTTNGSSGPDYPVALRAQDVHNGSNTPEIIFSEACYGAHIIDKQVDNALVLKFLISGSRVFVGSTVMSYGSISTPLNAADLLGVAFWKYLKDGNPAGVALQRAKIYLAREMHKRQGYLDGEDQKTLISFVYYGDPLWQTQKLPERNKTFMPKGRKAIVRPIQPPAQVKTVCDRSEKTSNPEPIPDEVMIHVKQVVAQYLPGMQGAQVMLSREHLECDCDGHDCPTAQLGQKSRPDAPPERRVVTLSKSIPFEKKFHPTYARLTLDKQGKVVKLAVSR